MSATDDAPLAAGVRWLATKRVTLGVVSFLFAVFAFELAVVWAYGRHVWEYLFLASLDPSPGLMMAPFAHRNISHFLTTVPVVLLYGGLVEEWLQGSRLLAFYVGASYASVAAQLLAYATGASGPGTLGSSGAGLALVALYVVWTAGQALRRPAGVSELDGIFAGSGLAVIGSILVNDFVPGIVFARGTATLGHAGGIVVGVAYGFVALRTQQQSGGDPTPAS